jgi:replicative superfamily II helicase
MRTLAERFDQAGRGDEADQWLRSAADAGNLNALHVLAGRLQLAGRDEDAEHIWRRIIEAGNSAAVQSLADQLERTDPTRANDLRRYGIEPGGNTPAAAVAIVGLTHPGPVPTAYSVAEYKNMVGRAGRLGFTDRGESYLIPEGALDAGRAWNLYVRGQLEDLRSQLVPDGDPRTLMLRVLASYPASTTGLVTEAAVLGFLDASLAAFQAREGGQAQWDRDQLARAFQQLVAASLISAEGDGYRLTELGRFTGESGIHVDSIIRLVYGLRGSVSWLNYAGLIAAAQLTNELNEIYIPVNARGTRTEVPRWPQLLTQQGVPTGVIVALQGTAQDVKQATARSKRAAAAVMWVAGVPIEQIEEQLNQHIYNRSGVAGIVRSVADRTRDLLPAVGAVARELDPDHAVDDLVERTMLRLELGISADLIDLARAINTPLTRPPWMRLRAAGHLTVEAVEQLNVRGLGRILGDERGAEIMQRELRDSNALARPAHLVIPTPTE